MKTKKDSADQLEKNERKETDRHIEKRREAEKMGLARGFENVHQIQTRGKVGTFFFVLSRLKYRSFCPDAN